MIESEVDFNPPYTVHTVIRLFGPTLNLLSLERWLGRVLVSFGPKAFVDHSLSLYSEVCVRRLSSLFPLGIVGLCMVCEETFSHLQSYRTLAAREFGWGGTSVRTQHRCPKDSSVRTETSHRV